MAFTAASIADGQVSDSTAAIYTVPASTSAILKSLTFFNTNAAPQTINVYVTRSGGTRRQLFRFILAQYATAVALTDGEILALSTGDALEADTTTASAVDFLITGATES